VSLFEGFLQRRILFFTEVSGDIFGASDNTGEREAGFGVGSDVIGDGFGSLVVADDDSTEGGSVAVFKSKIAHETDEAAENTEEEEAGDGGVESHNTDWEKVELEEEVDGDNSHHADERGTKEASNFGPATATEKDGLFIEAETGKNEDINWNEREHGEDKTTGIGSEVEGALVEMGTHEIGHQKGEDDRESVPQDEENVEDYTKVPFHKYIIA